MLKTSVFCETVMTVRNGPPQSLELKTVEGLCDFKKIQK